MTGKNKINFVKWFDKYSDNCQSAMIGDLDIYPDEIFDLVPFEMQLGILIKYYDDLGMIGLIETEYTIQSLNDLSPIEAYKEAFKNIDIDINKK